MPKLTRNEIGLRNSLQRIDATGSADAVMKKLQALDDLSKLLSSNTALTTIERVKLLNPTAKVTDAQKTEVTELNKVLLIQSDTEYRLGYCENNNGTKEYKEITIQVKSTQFLKAMTAESFSLSPELKDSLDQILKTKHSLSSTGMSGQTREDFVKLVNQYFDVLDNKVLPGERLEDKSTRLSSLSRAEMQFFQNELILKKAGVLLARDKTLLQPELLSEAQQKLSAKLAPLQKQIQDSEKEIAIARDNLDQMQRKCDAMPENNDANRADKQRIKAQIDLEAKKISEKEKSLQALQEQAKQLTDSLKKIAGSSDIDNAKQIAVQAKEKMEEESKKKADQRKYDNLKKYIEEYETAFAKYQTLIKAYNDSKENDIKVRPEPTRQLSPTVRGVINSITRESNKPSITGYVYKIVTDKDFLDEVQKPDFKKVNAVRITNKSAELRTGVLGANELNVAVQSYAQGASPGAASSMVIRDPHTNEVTVKSENLTPDQLKKEAIEAAQLYLLNYSGEDDIIIMGDDKEKASMIHAVLLTLDPTVSVKNYVEGAAKPEDDKYKPSMITWNKDLERKKAFIKEHLGDDAKTVIDTYRQELSQVHVKKKEKGETSTERFNQYKAEAAKALSAKSPGANPDEIKRMAREEATERREKEDKLGHEGEEVISSSTPRR